MKVAALIGDPVEHSVAPILHEYMARLLEIEFRYLKLRVPAESLAEAAGAMKTLHFAGYNVTIPHKEDIGQYLDRVDDVASQMGAVNTVVIDDEGTAVGTNTDWIGIVQGLIHHGHPERAESDQSAVILGSGGAARAAIHALKSLGYKQISVFYLEPEDHKTRRLKELAATTGEFTMKPYDTVAEAIADAAVVCNMTSAGMHGNGPAAFDLELITGLDLEDKWFFDAVFNPLNTPFLQAAQRGRATTVDGLWMMIYQGIPAFTAWVDREISLDKSELTELHRLLSHALADT